MKYLSDNRLTNTRSRSSKIHTYTYNSKVIVDIVNILYAQLLVQLYSDYFETLQMIRSASGIDIILRLFLSLFCKLNFVTLV